MRLRNIFLVLGVGANEEIHDREAEAKGGDNQQSPEKEYLTLKPKARGTAPDKGCDPFRKETAANQNDDGCNDQHKQTRETIHKAFEVLIWIIKAVKPGGAAAST